MSMMCYGQCEIPVKFHAFCKALSIVSLSSVRPGFNGTIYGPLFQGSDLLLYCFSSVSLIDATHKDVDVLLLLSNSAYYVA